MNYYNNTHGIAYRSRPLKLKYKIYKINVTLNFFMKYIVQLFKKYIKQYAYNIYAL